MGKAFDPLKLMNAVVRFTPDEGVPPMDDRWLMRVAALCEYVAKLKAVLHVRTEQYRARCEGVVRDANREKELLAATEALERIEKTFGVGG